MRGAVRQVVDSCLEACTVSLTMNAMWSGCRPCRATVVGCTCAHGGALGACLLSPVVHQLYPLANSSCGAPPPPLVSPACSRVCVTTQGQYCGCAMVLGWQRPMASGQLERRQYEPSLGGWHPSGGWVCPCPRPWFTALLCGTGSCVRVHPPLSLYIVVRVHVL